MFFITLPVFRKDILLFLNSLQLLQKKTVVKKLSKILTENLKKKGRKALSIVFNCTVAESAKCAFLLLDIRTPSFCVSKLFFGSVMLSIFDFFHFAWHQVQAKNFFSKRVYRA